MVLHTNFGRAPLARAALDAIADAAARYSTLEYDADKGARGSRQVHCAGLLTELTGAKDALVVNTAARRCCWCWPSRPTAAARWCRAAS